MLPSPGEPYIELGSRTRCSKTILAKVCETDMIHFTCEHCLRSVRVEDRYGGKKGRCPHCKETVTIPPCDAISELAAAFGTNRPKADDTGAMVVPPPPGVGEKPLSDELILPDETDVDLDDTVILPAGTFAEKETEPSRTNSSRPSRHAPIDSHRPALNTLRTILILVAVIVVLIVAVLGFALATRLF